MCNLLPAVEMLSELPTKLKFFLLNNIQVVLSCRAEFLKFSNNFILYLSLVRHYLLLDFLVYDVYADLLETLSPLKDTLYYFSDLMVMLLLFFFLKELFVHYLVNLFMHELIQFPLLHIVEVFHHVEILSELPEIAREIEPTPQCVLNRRCDAFTREVDNLLADWVYQMGELG